MKTIKLYLFTTLVLASSVMSFGQSISPAPGNSTICPGQFFTYTVSPNPGFTGCGTFTWTLSNGTFVSGQSVTTTTTQGFTVSVMWNDVASTGTLTVTSTCAEGVLSVSKTYAIKSLAGRTPTNPQAYQALPFCSVATILIGVDVMFLLNTGGNTGIDQQRADGYEWVLPVGWSYAGLTGTVSTPQENINIYPDNGCRAGTVSVRAYMDCTSGKKYSSSATISLARPAPSIFITPQAGYAGPGCGGTQPVTFTVNHSLSCVAPNNGFQWVFPAGWNASGIFTNSNSITLTPSGGAADGGPINVTVNLTCGTQLASTPYQLVFVAPAINVATPICDYGTSVTMSNVASGVTVTWSVTSNMSIYSGQGTSSAVMQAPLNAGSLGYGTISASVSCPGTTVEPKSVWVGTPSQPGQVSGNQAPSVGSIYQYTVSYGSTGAANYDWILPFYGDPVWSVSGGTVSGPIDTLTPNFFAGSSPGYVQVFGQNVCGNSGVSKLKVLPQGGSCTTCPRIAQDNKSDADTTFAKIALYPNPSNTEFKIRLPAPAEQEGQLSLIDLSGNVKSNGIIQKGTQWITLGTSDLFSGMYVIKINDGSKVYYRKVLVQH